MTMTKFMQKQARAVLDEHGVTLFRAHGRL